MHDVRRGRLAAAAHNDNEEGSLHAQEVNLFQSQLSIRLRLAWHCHARLLRSRSESFSPPLQRKFRSALVWAWPMWRHFSSESSLSGDSRGWAIATSPRKKFPTLSSAARSLGCLLGGRLGYMLFYDLQNFLQNPLIFFRVMDGGMSAHGGMLGSHAVHALVFLSASGLLAQHRRQPGRRGADRTLPRTGWRTSSTGSSTAASPVCLGRCSFPRSSTKRPRRRCSQVLSEAAAINPNWTTIEDVIENVRHSPALRDVLAGALSPRHPSQFYEAALEGVLLFAILWILAHPVSTAQWDSYRRVLCRLRDSAHDWRALPRTRCPADRTAYSRTVSLAFPAGDRVGIFRLCLASPRISQFGRQEGLRLAAVMVVVDYQRGVHLACGRALARSARPARVGLCLPRPQRSYRLSSADSLHSSHCAPYAGAAGRGCAPPSRASPSASSEDLTDWSATLLPAGHVLGSAQLLYQDCDGHAALHRRLQAAQRTFLRAGRDSAGGNSGHGNHLRVASLSVSTYRGDARQRS